MARRTCKEEMKKSYAKELKVGPVFRLDQDALFGGSWHLEGRGKGIGNDWASIALLTKRKYALVLMKAITLEARRKK